MFSEKGTIKGPKLRVHNLQMFISAISGGGGGSRALPGGGNGHSCTENFLPTGQEWRVGKYLGHSYENTIVYRERI